MKRAWTLAALVVAACGFGGKSAVDDDASVGRDGSISDGAIVDAVDAPIDGSTSVDTDNDGHVDAMDNCPTMSNADQRNYDGDPRGDACDACPHVANQDADPDGDNIGVGCDPRPNAQDARLLWTSFHDATTIANWSLAGGSWAVQNSALRQTDTAAVNATASPPLAADLGPVYVATSMKTDGFGSPLASVTFGVASAVAADQFYACIVQDLDDPDLLASSDWPGAPGSTSSMTATDFGGSLAVDSRLDLVHHTLSTNDCTLRQGGVSASAGTSRSSTFNGAINLFTTRVALTFEYLFIVQIGS